MAITEIQRDFVSKIVYSALCIVLSANNLDFILKVFRIPGDLFFDSYCWNLKKHIKR
jgi:hypothetical protein